MTRDVDRLEDLQDDQIRKLDQEYLVSQENVGAHAAAARTPAAASAAAAAAALLQSNSTSVLGLSQHLTCTEP
jgi:hypothetical protein